MKKIAFYPREKIHSKGNIGYDRVILNMVENKIKSYGYKVKSLNTDAIEYTNFEDYSLIFSMSRTIDNLHILEETILDDDDNHKIPIINKPESTSLTLRKTLYDIIKNLGLPIPEFHLINPYDLDERIKFPFWLKRTDYHHINTNDVFFVDNSVGCKEAEKHFYIAGYDEVIYQKNIPGMSVKFYGVYKLENKKISFFATYPQIPQKHSDNIKEIVLILQSKLKLEIFGGDVIVNNDGVFIIDFNSWPSFKYCSVAAAEAIADYGREILETNG